jgi:arsenical pump membrane protein
MSPTLIWLVAAGAIAGVLFRPGGWPEAIWACLGAFILVLSGLLPWSQAGTAIAKGSDVYLFLAGMMLLSELARRQGVFDWLASLAVKAAHSSPTRLFLLIYLVGTAVTVFLSNDATAVVLTPAVYAAVKKAGTKALPYLCRSSFGVRCRTGSSLTLRASANFGIRKSSTNRSAGCWRIPSRTRLLTTFPASGCNYAI